MKKTNISLLVLLAFTGLLFKGEWASAQQKAIPAMYCANQNGLGGSSWVIAFASVKTYNYSESKLKSVVPARPTLYMNDDFTLRLDEIGLLPTGSTATVSLPDTGKIEGSNAGQMPTQITFQDNSAPNPQSTVLTLVISNVGSTVVALADLKMNGGDEKQLLICHLSVPAERSAP